MSSTFAAPEVMIDANLMRYYREVQTEPILFQDFFERIPIVKSVSLSDISIYLSSLNLLDATGKPILAARPGGNLDGKMLDPIMPESADIAVFTGSCETAGYDLAHVIGSEIIKIVSTEQTTESIDSDTEPVNAHDYNKMNSVARRRIFALIRTGGIFGILSGLNIVDEEVFHNTSYSVEEVLIQSLILSSVLGHFAGTSRKRRNKELFSADDGLFSDRLTVKPEANDTVTLKMDALRVLSKRTHALGPKPTRMLGVNNSRFDKSRTPFVYVG